MYLFCFLFLIVQDGLINCEAENGVIDRIVPKNYDLSVPPNAKGITPVDIHMTIQGVTNIDEKENTFDVDLFLALSWQDKRLNLTSPAKGTFYTFPVHPLLDNIWHPRVFFKGAKSVTIFEHPHPSEYFWIHEENYLVHMIKLQAKQRFDFSTMPESTRIYRIIIESLSDDATKMDMKWNPERAVILDQNFITPEATIHDLRYNEYKNSYGGKDFSIAEVTFKIRKQGNKKRRQ